MKHHVRITTPILSVIAAALLTTQQAAAQTPSPAIPSTTASAADTAHTGVNPMTGRPLTEEDLHRQLNKSKLITQLGQEQVKQAQNSADLALANLRAETERTRARAETLAQMSSFGATKASGVTLIKPAQNPPNVVASRQNAASKATSAGQASTPSDVQVPALGPSASGGQPSARPSGTIQIGGETLEIASTASQTQHAQVQWVDSQTRQAARAGSPLQPINVQPATGVLGIPAIPGIMPSPLPPNQPQ